jgi:hypothetical protein
MAASLVGQVPLILKSLKKFGESKFKAKQKVIHEKKKRKYEKLKAKGKDVNFKEIKVPICEISIPGIFSYSTFRTYLSCGVQYAKWLQINHCNVKWLKDSFIYVPEYFTYLKEKKGLAPTTLTKHRSALAKIFGKPASEFNFEFLKRKQEDIFKGRKIQPWDYKIRELFSEELEVLSIIGARRHEAVRMKVSQISKDFKKIYGVKGKNGKIRTITVLDPKILRQYVESHPNEDGKIFAFLPPKMNIQRERNRYTLKFYQMEFDRLFPDGGKNIHYREKNRAGKMKWYISRDGKRKFLKKILYKISRNLGHNRISVIVRHYLWEIPPIVAPVAA